MEIDIGAPVLDRDGRKAGEVSHIVYDGRTQQVTHVVVGKGWLLPRDIVVAVEEVAEASDEGVRLRLDARELDRQPDFIEEHYVAPSEGEAVPAGYPPAAVRYQPVVPAIGMSWAFPSQYLMPLPPVEATLNVPPGSVTLDQGMDVWVGDDKAGTLAGVRVHPRTEEVTHLVISRGMLLPDERLVPRSAIQTVDEQGIHLALSPDQLRALPSAEHT